MTVSLQNLPSNIEETYWPDSLPFEGEKYFLSLSCGNSFLHWAFHNAVASGDLEPVLFWRTPTLIAEDFDCDIVDILSRHLPELAHDYIFGEGESPSIAAAQKQANLHDVPRKLSVYIVSSNTDQIGMMSKLLGIIPVRIFVMRGADFFSIDEGRYPSMGVDRLSTLRGAEYLCGFPSLVFDGGTAVTYSAADSDGIIMGGGISPGISTRLKCLHDSTDALPEISIEEFSGKIENAILDKKPLDTFAKDTKDAMMVSVLNEISHSARSVIRLWLDKVGLGKKIDQDAEKNLQEQRRKKMQNTERKVLVTGGSGELITQLLNHESGSIIELPKGSKNENFNVLHTKNLIHFGVSAALLKYGKTQVLKDKKTDEEKVHLKDIVGLRVAKKFADVDVDGDQFFRGTVNKKFIDDDIQMFLVLYDDGDKEHVTLDEVNEMRDIFKEVGEKKKKSKSNSKEPIKSTSDENNSKSNAKMPKKVKKLSSKETKSRARNIKRKENPVHEDMTSNKPKIKKTSQVVLKRSKDVQNKIRSTKGKTTSPATKRRKVETVYDGSLVSKRVAKDFDGNIFFGTIKSYDDSLWHVLYDDGDEEDYDINDLKASIKLYEQKRSSDPEVKGLKKMKSVGEEVNDVSSESVSDSESSDEDYS